MSEGSRKLIAWLDGELASEEAAAMEHHVRACAECSEQLAGYKKISKWVDAYCDAVVAGHAGHARRAPAAVVAAGVTAAVVAAVLLLSPHRPAQRAATETAALAGVVATAAVHEAPRATTKRKIRLRPAAAPEQAQLAEARPAEPTIEVALPADGMFAPGAVPEGVTFVADVSIAPDGSVGQFRLGP